MKICFRFGISKSVTDYYRHARMADGYLGKCKDCTKRDVALLRVFNPEIHKQRDLDRNRTQKRIDQRREYLRRHRAKYPHKARARAAVSFALRAGNLERRPCRECGIELVQAHHEDYSRPLDIVWLCEFHHKQRHRELEDQGVFL